jgi:hypothetical protein
VARAREARARRATTARDGESVARASRS